MACAFVRAASGTRICAAGSSALSLTDAEYDGGRSRRYGIKMAQRAFRPAGPLLPVVGSDRSVEAPPGVCAAPSLFQRDVAIPQTTLTGLTGLSERSVRRSGVIGSPPPPRRLYDHEDFRRSAVRAVVRPPGGSRRLHLPLRVRAKVPSLTMPGQVAPPGVSRPFSDIGGGICMTRVCLTRHVPSPGFLAPSTVSSPSGLADSLGPLPLLGFSLAQLFRAPRPWCVAAPAASLRLWCSTASNSEEYEVESSTGSKTLEPLRPGSMAMVPELPSPLRSTSFPDRHRGFRPRSSPHSLAPSASG